MKKLTMGGIAALTLALASGCSSSPAAERSEQASEQIYAPEPGCRPTAWSGSQFEQIARQICTNKTYDTGQYVATFYIAKCFTGNSGYGPCPADGWVNEWQTVYDLQRCWANTAPYSPRVDTSADCVTIPPNYVALTWDPGGCGTSCM
jgi:hypothetical protein